MEVSTASLLKLGSFTFWCGLYVWCSVRAPERSPEWWSRAVTLLHGSTATVAGLMQCPLRAVSHLPLTAKVLPHHYVLMVWSWGYFAFDLLWCLMYWRDNRLMLCHHVAALGAITLYMEKEYAGCSFACALAFMEVTNPLLQIRWFLRYEGYDKSILYYVIEATYLILFLTIRGILGTYMIFKIMNCNIFDMEAKVISLVFYMVSVAFIYEIVGYVLYKYKTKINEFRGWLEEMEQILNDQI